VDVGPPIVADAQAAGHDVTRPQTAPNGSCVVAAFNKVPQRIGKQRRGHTRSRYFADQDHVSTVLLRALNTIYGRAPIAARASANPCLAGADDRSSASAVANASAAAAGSPDCRRKTPRLT